MNKEIFNDVSNPVKYNFIIYETQCNLYTFNRKKISIFSLKFVHIFRLENQKKLIQQNHLLQLNAQVDLIHSIHRFHKSGLQ